MANPSAGTATEQDYPLELMRALNEEILSLKAALAERDAECERLSRLAQECEGYANHLAECANCWHDRPCDTAEIYLGQIDMLGASAAVAPAARETEICANCGKPRTEHLVSTRGRGHHHEWCYRDDKRQSDAKQFSVFAAVAPAARTEEEA